jgi:predicted dehydrogenase
MINIGIIGMSAGNAHPYSWSAIINGVFNAEEITRCGYPGVSAYLTANRDTLGLPQAKVTHVWAQDRAISESIAKTTKIKNIVDDLETMAAQVDAVILARDDAENHVEMCKPFFNANIPVFIDKPLAIREQDLLWFEEQYANGKFFMSCSSMRYANECRTAKTELASLGKIALVTCVGKKDWRKYGVHLLEALFALLDDPQAVSVRHIGKTDKDIVQVSFENGIQATVHLFMDISSTFQLTVFGQNAWKLVDVRNSYSMFRDNIIEFIRSVEEGKPRLAFSKTQNIINTLISAETSMQRGGSIIELKKRA